MLIQLAVKYIEALNGGKVPTIENAWNYMQAGELERAFKEVVSGEMEKGFKEKIEKKLPLSEEVLKAEAQKIKQECL